MCMLPFYVFFLYFGVLCVCFPELTYAHWGKLLSLSGGAASHFEMHIKIRESKEDEIRDSRLERKKNGERQ